MRELQIILHNIRSTHNVGSLLRTAEGLGITKVYLTGYTPYPQLFGDTRLPHLSRKLTAQIHKTALGAEKLVPIDYREDIMPLLDEIEQAGVTIAALEQTQRAVPLCDYEAPERLCLVLGEEVHGVPAAVLDRLPVHVVIPMFGSKESYNVSAAAAMALHELRFH